MYCIDWLLVIYIIIELFKSFHLDTKVLALLVHKGV